MQHAGSERCGTHCIRYHGFLIPANQELPDGIAFAHGDNAAFGSKESVGSIEAGLNQQEGDSDENVEKKSGSNKSSDSERSWSELSVFKIEADHVPEDDQSVRESKYTQGY